MEINLFIQTIRQAKRMILNNKDLEIVYGFLKGRGVKISPFKFLDFVKEVVTEDLEMRKRNVLHY